MSFRKLINRPSLVFGISATLFALAMYGLSFQSILKRTQLETYREFLDLGLHDALVVSDSVCSAEWNALGIKKIPGPKSYTDAKIEVYTLKKELAEQHRAGTISLDSVKGLFAENLLNTVIPYWYGTPWSFEGHTAIPNKGKIACGYFISTTLRDMGLMLNRYKLAQKGPLEEAMSIGCGAPVTTLVTKNHNEAIAAVESLVQDGIYIIGFGAGHVGYLLQREGLLYVIHSNYLYPGVVEIECLRNSRVFQSFSTFHIVNVSHNDFLILRWLNSLAIEQ
ncbi:hypothetical protein [Croceitalea dokdonensis]|uniref:hypothetical protein n=1 Tax=Croceitalea dokdonensis TaxID=346188 RepID=UPI0012F810E8|nr:hypothetical protein [Croceitalea dokdonensis]